MIQNMPYLALPLDGTYAAQGDAAPLFGYLFDYHPLALFEGMHFFAGPSQETLEGKDNCYYIVLQHPDIQKLRRLQIYLSGRNVMHRLILRDKKAARDYIYAQPLEYAGVLQKGHIEGGNAAIMAALSQYKPPFTDEDISEEAMKRALKLQQERQREEYERRRQQRLEEAERAPMSEDAPAKAARAHKPMPEAQPLNLPGYISDIDVLLLNDEQIMPNDAGDVVRPMSIAHLLPEVKPIIPTDEGPPSTSLANLTPAPEIGEIELDEAERAGVDPNYALDNALLAMARTEAEDIPEDSSAAIQGGLVPTSTERAAPELPEDIASDKPLEVFGDKALADAENDPALGSMPEHTPVEGEAPKEGVIRLDSPNEPAMEIRPGTITPAETLIPQPTFEYKRKFSSRAVGIIVSFTLLCLIVGGYLFSNFYFGRLREERRAIATGDIQTMSMMMLFSLETDTMRVKSAEVTEVDYFAEDFTISLRLCSTVPNTDYIVDTVAPYDGQDAHAFLQNFSGISSYTEEPAWQEDLILRAEWSGTGIRLIQREDDRAALHAMKNKCVAAELSAKLSAFHALDGESALRDILLPQPTENVTAAPFVLGEENNTARYNEWLTTWQADASFDTAEALKPLLISLKNIKLRSQGNVWLLTFEAMDTSWYFPRALEAARENSATPSTADFLASCVNEQSPLLAFSAENGDDWKTQDIKVQIPVDIHSIAYDGVEGCPPALEYLREYLKNISVYINQLGSG